jgi:hypothetical protein
MMCSYNRLNQIYACENEHLLNGITKTEPEASVLLKNVDNILPLEKNLEVSVFSVMMLQIQSIV